MEIQIITKQDLHDFHFQLLHDIKEIIQSKPSQPKQWLRSSEIRKLLNISPGTLQNMRINGTLTYKKIGGIIFYSHDQIQRLMDQS